MLKLQLPFGSILVTLGLSVAFNPFSVLFFSFPKLVACSDNMAFPVPWRLVILPIIGPCTKTSSQATDKSISVLWPFLIPCLSHAFSSIFSLISGLDCYLLVTYLFPLGTAQYFTIFFIYSSTAWHLTIKVFSLTAWHSTIDTLQSLYRFPTTASQFTCTCTPIPRPYLFYNSISTRCRWLPFISHRYHFSFFNTVCI